MQRIKGAALRSEIPLWISPVPQGRPKIAGCLKSPGFVFCKFMKDSDPIAWSDWIAGLIKNSCIRKINF